MMVWPYYYSMGFIGVVAAYPFFNLLTHPHYFLLPSSIKDVFGSHDGNNKLNTRHFSFFRSAKCYLILSMKQPRVTWIRILI
jgi:hypothetical protein